MSIIGAREGDIDGDKSTYSVVGKYWICGFCSSCSILLKNDAGSLELEDVLCSGIGRALFEGCGAVQCRCWIYLICWARWDTVE